MLPQGSQEYCMKRDHTNKMFSKVKQIILQRGKVGNKSMSLYLKPFKENLGDGYNTYLKTDSAKVQINHPPDNVNRISAEQMRSLTVLNHFLPLDDIFLVLFQKLVVHDLTPRLCFQLFGLSFKISHRLSFILRVCTYSSK